LNTLEVLIDAMKHSFFHRTIEVKNGDQVVGGLILVEYKNSLLYLKGAFSKESKDQGAMYAAMNEAIAYARSNSLRFDFGGSRVEGVRRFNINLGGQDVHYAVLKWNHAPFWFNFLKKMKGKWKTK
jgi:hypothetical protein